MRYNNPGLYLAALNAAYTMLGYADGYSAKLETLESPSNGYMIAIDTIGKFPNLSSVCVHSMTTVLREKASKLDESLLYIGSFRDPNTKELMFELSINIDNLDKAKEIGGIHDQEYIYDVINKEVIKL